MKTDTCKIPNYELLEEVNVWEANNWAVRSIQPAEWVQDGDAQRVTTWLVVFEESE